MSGYGYSWSYDEPEWDSEYDSTWEDDEDHQLLKQSNPKKKKNRLHSRGNRAAQDLQRYRHGYPEPMPNLKFYRNEIPFEPYGVHIDDLHNYWKYDYHELESNHSYIQWLFPLREPGMNRSASPLTEKEMEEMKKDKAVMQRLLESYKLMLGFYGIELLDSKTGEVTRADNWRERFYNLNINTHNNIRITRILKCLGELGYERYQVPLVKFFLEETLCHGNLKNVKTSALNYFMFTVKNKSERRELVLFAWEHYEPKEEFTWGPMETLRKLKPPAPVEKPDNESESMDIEYKNKSFQKNGRSKDDSEFQNKARECKQENMDARKSHWLTRLLYSKKGSLTEFGSEDKTNGKQPIQSGAAIDKDNKGSPMESESVDSKEKGAPIDSMSGNDKEDKNPPTVSYSGNQKVNKESPIESRSKCDKENKEIPTESESREDNENEHYQVESESEDKRKGGPPMRSGLNDDIEKRGSLTEFGSEDKTNGKQPIQSGAANYKDNKGSPMESESVYGKEKEEAPSDSMSGNDKEYRKTPTVSYSGNEKVNKESPIESRSKCDKEKEEIPTESESREDSENEGSEAKSESEDKRKGGPPMRSGLNDDIEKRGSPTEFGSEDKVNGEQPMQSGAANDKDNKGPPTESESVDSKEKKGAPMDCMSDNDKEDRKPPTDSGSEDDQENGAQSMQSGAVDDKSNTLPPT